MCLLLTCGNCRFFCNASGREWDDQYPDDCRHHATAARITNRERAAIKNEPMTRNGPFYPSPRKREPPNFCQYKENH